jgi:ComF family protein
MSGPARAAVHGLKYRYQRGFAAVMAAEMAVLAEREPFDSAYAVPLHRLRQRTRGFNQSTLLLRELGWDQGPGKLARVRRTGRQVGLGLRDRRRNVAGAFRYTGPDLQGKRIALVDDVVTTGATARECAAVLKDHGAGRVVVLAFARASYRHGATVDRIYEDR